MRAVVIKCNGCGKVLYDQEKEKCDEHKTYFVGTHVDGLITPYDTNTGMEEMHFCPECESRFLKNWHINVDDFRPVNIKY